MSPALVHSTTRRAAFSGERATILGAITVACLVALALQWPAARDILLTGRFNDTDDAMRMVMVRDFMAGQAWHDLVQHRVMSPAGLAMHWSRLIDLPIAALIAAFGLVAEAAVAERLTRIMVPAFVSVIFFASAISLSVRLAGRAAAWPAALVASTCLALTYQFVPGRVDHHDVQIVLSLLLAMQTIAASERSYGAMRAGAIGALMMAIGLESLHVVAVAGMAFVSRWILCGRRQPMVAFAGTLAGATMVFFVLGVQPAAWHQPVCDAIGLPILALTCAGVAITVALAAAPRFLSTPARRGAAAAAAGAIAMAVLFSVFPQCQAGPYGFIPPDIKAIWLGGVGEARPALSVLQESPAAGVATLGAGCAGLVALALLAWLDRGKRSGWLTLFAFGLASLAVTLYQIRGAGILTALVLPGSVGLMVLLWQGGRRAASLISAVAASSLIWTVLAASLLPAGQPSTSRQCLEPALYAALERLPPAVIAAPTDLGAHLLAHTAHAVLGAPYHRNIAGIRLSHAFFTAPPEAARHLLMQSGATYLVTCGALRDMADMARDAPGGLAALILADKAPAWLELQNATGPMHVWRIGPAAQQSR